MSYKLKAYRVAGGAACPEAIIFYLLLYALLYILKHVTRNGRVHAKELHEVSRTTKPRKASLSFLFKLSMSSLRLLMPPRAAYALYEADVSQRRSKPSPLVARSYQSQPPSLLLSRLDELGLHRRRLPVADNALVPTALPTLPTTITAIPDIIADILSVRWVNNPVIRLGHIVTELDGIAID